MDILTIQTFPGNGKQHLVIAAMTDGSNHARGSDAELLECEALKLWFLTWHKCQSLLCTTYPKVTGTIFQHASDVGSCQIHIVIHHRDRFQFALRIQAESAVAVGRYHNNIEYGTERAIVHSMRLTIIYLRDCLSVKAQDTILADCYYASMPIAKNPHHRTYIRAIVQYCLMRIHTETGYHIIIIRFPQPVFPINEYTWIIIIVVMIRIF